MSNLNPYSGSWDLSKAAFLLQRTTFGASKQDIDEALEIGVEATIKKLFETGPLPSPPIHLRTHICIQHNGKRSVPRAPSHSCKD